MNIPVEQDCCSCPSCNPPVVGRGICYHTTGATDQGYKCTAVVGHTGDHVAHNIFDAVVHRWPQNKPRTDDLDPNLVKFANGISWPLPEDQS